MTKMFTPILLLCSLLLLLSSAEQQDFQTLCQAGIRQDNTNYIHCARKQLTEIPNFTRITNTFYDELVLNDNQILQIPANAFQGLRVKRLNLSGNRLRSISSEAFRELVNYLEELTIEFDPDHIDHIPDAIHDHLFNLRTLKLIGLNLRRLEQGTFSKFRKLEHLSLIKSNIESIQSDALITLNHLRSLNLDHNRLNDSSWLNLTSYLIDLEVLVLSQNQFRSIRQEHFTPLKALKILDLSSNGLQSIDANSLPSSLEKLYLQNNELNSLQLTFLFQLRELKEFNLDFNRLTFLPEKIFHWNGQLGYLSLQGNDLNSLTNQSLLGLKSLGHLNLARNRLQFSANQQPFQYLKSLKLLNLDRNAQMNLSVTTFTGLAGTLQELSLQNCHLSSIDPILIPFVHLQRLKLSSNQLTDLSISSLFHSRDTLISIDLQRNRFTSLPKSPFNLSLLIDLDLSTNQISNIDRNDLRPYPQLKTLGLTANPLNCDCHLRWIKQWLWEKYDRDLIRYLQWSCTKPAHLLGKQLTAIEEQEMVCQATPPATVTKSSPIVPLRTSSSESLTSLSSPEELTLKEIRLHGDGILTINWESAFSRLPKQSQLQIYDETHRYLLLQRSLVNRQRSMEVNTTEHLLKLPSNYLICVRIRHNKYCRNVLLQADTQSASSLTSPNEQYLYILGGGLLGALLICSLLILVCFWRLGWPSKGQPIHLSSIDFDDKNSKPTFHYHPLNFLSYPSATSNHTSECSLHSSMDTSQSTTEPYHLYQQISSIHHCRIHSTRTPNLL